MAVAIVGCGGGEQPPGFTCGELREDPDRYSSLARTIFEDVVPPVERNNPQDCDRTCARNFTRSVRRRLVAACRDASADYRPQQAVTDQFRDD